MKRLVLSQMSSPVPGGLGTVFALLGLVAIEMLFLRILVGTQVAKYSQNLEGKKPGLFDLRRTGYSYQEARAMVGAYGPEGRRWYLWGSVRSLDILLTLSYGSLFVLSGVHSIALLRGNSQLGWVIASLGLVAVVLDFIENLAVNVMLTQDPDSYTDWET
jgi:hypothetical protein